MRRLATAALLAASVAAASADARAAGYAVGQEAVSSIGVAHAGGAAAADDASTVFYNPAGLTRLKGTQMMFGATGIFPFVDYDEQSSKLFNGNAYAGGEGGDGGQDALIPNFYGVYGLTDRVKLGLGINSPFGLVTNYDNGWKGRYSEITTSLKSFNFNPAIAVTVLPGLSVGAGASVQYLRGVLSQAIDFGSNCAILTPALCAGFGLSPGNSDGFGKVKATGVGYGFNVGLLYEPMPGTRFGAHYRSRMNFQMTGRGKFDVPTGARQFLNTIGIPTAFTKAHAKLGLVEPEMASVSAYHEFTDKWAVMGDVTWTRWGVFDHLRIKFDNQTPDNFLRTDWSNVFRYSLGTTYRWSPDLLLRGGVAYDDSPIKTAFRGPGIPDSDRIVFALGLGYAVSDGLWMDAAYQHLIFRTGNTRRLSATSSTLSGDFHVNVDVIGISFTKTF